MRFLRFLLATAVVLVVALLIGFRPKTDPGEWLAAAGVLALTAFAISWLSVALGMSTKSVETASNLPMFLTLLPFLGSGFVPTQTMPDGLRCGHRQSAACRGRRYPSSLPAW